jgi:mannose-1-phosphate guanylyltransferase
VVETVERARSLTDPERIRILTGRALVDPFLSVLDEFPEGAFLVEPRARGTGPVLAWAAHELVAKDPDAVLVSLHSDHLIRPLEDFRRTVLAATELASRDELLLCLGVTPDRPETGYGYIQPGPEVEVDEGLRAHRVAAFHEKPDGATATRYVDEGYLWNTGIFVWKASVLLEEIRRHAPEIAGALGYLDDGDVEGFFREVTPVSVDVAVMERSDRVGVVGALFEWDDIGAWHALYRTRRPDDGGNVILGDGMVREGSGNVVYADEGDVVLFGVDDLVVVRTGRVTLVTRRDRSADLKELLDRLPDDLREAP